MTGALHVTNGDCAEEVLRQNGLAREILSWRDVLHEGPVPAVGAEELRRIRAAFLADAGAADMGVLADLTERDRTLEAHRDAPRVPVHAGRARADRAAHPRRGRRGRAQRR